MTLYLDSNTMPTYSFKTPLLQSSSKITQNQPLGSFGQLQGVNQPEGMHAASLDQKPSSFIKQIFLSKLSLKERAKKIQQIGHNAFGETENQVQQIKQESSYQQTTKNNCYERLCEQIIGSSGDPISINLIHSTFQNSNYLQFLAALINQMNSARNQEQVAWGLYKPNIGFIECLLRLTSQRQELPAPAKYLASFQISNFIKDCQQKGLSTLLRKSYGLYPYQETAGCKLPLYYASSQSFSRMVAVGNPHYLSAVKVLRHWFDQNQSKMTNPEKASYAILLGNLYLILNLQPQQCEVGLEYQTWARLYVLYLNQTQARPLDPANKNKIIKELQSIAKKEQKNISDRFRIVKSFIVNGPNGLRGLTLVQETQDKEVSPDDQLCLSLAYRVSELLGDVKQMDVYRSIADKYISTTTDPDILLKVFKNQTEITNYYVMKKSLPKFSYSHSMLVSISYWMYLKYPDQFLTAYDYLPDAKKIYILKSRDLLDKQLYQPYLAKVKRGWQELSQKYGISFEELAEFDRQWNCFHSQDCLSLLLSSQISPLISPVGCYPSKDGECLIGLLRKWINSVYLVISDRFIDEKTHPLLSREWLTAVLEKATVLEQLTEEETQKLEQICLAVWSSVKQCM